MPTYQYTCTDTDCGHRFELVQSFTDPAASECPVCGQRVRKVYGSVGVVFKGSGFYRTDSRAAEGSGEGKPKADAKGKTESGSGSGSGGKDAAPSTGSSPKTESSKPSSGGSGSSTGTSGTKAAASA